MTRLLLLAACFAGSLAYVQRHDMKRDGYTNTGYAGNGEVIDITYNVVDKGQEGSTPVQNLAAPTGTPGGLTHEVRGHNPHLCIAVQLTKDRSRSP